MARSDTLARHVLSDRNSTTVHTLHSMPALAPLAASYNYDPLRVAIVPVCSPQRARTKAGVVAETMWSAPLERSLGEKNKKKVLTLWLHFVRVLFPPLVHALEWRGTMAGPLSDARQTKQQGRFFLGGGGGGGGVNVVSRCGAFLRLSELCYPSLRTLGFPPSSPIFFLFPVWSVFARLNNGPL